MTTGQTGEISVFVDESGSFEPTVVSSRFYLVCFVFHDQSRDISGLVSEIGSALSGLGLSPNHCVHAGPLIRREGEYQNMLREERRGIFAKMLAFTRKAPISYHRFIVDKHFNDGDTAVHDSLLQAMAAFLVNMAPTLNSYDTIKVYYDNGQSQVMSVLREAFAMFSSKTDFVDDVRPEKYRLFQVADMICTVELIGAKLERGGGLSTSEDPFFGGAHKFKRNILKQIRSKSI